MKIRRFIIELDVDNAVCLAFKNNEHDRFISYYLSRRSISYALGFFQMYQNYKSHEPIQSTEN